MRLKSPDTVRSNGEAMPSLAETERPSSICMPPVASNRLGQHRTGRSTSPRRASRQESASVVVSRWRHPNRRSAFKKCLAAKHYVAERSDPDVTTQEFRRARLYLFSS